MEANTIKQHGASPLLLKCPVRQVWSTSLVFQFSRRQSDLVAAAETEGERELLEVKTAAKGGRRWMEGTPEDQSGTRNHGRSSFSSWTLVNATPSQYTSHQLCHPTTYTTPCLAHVYEDRKAVGNMRSKESLGMGGQRGSWEGADIWGCIDCLHCGVIAIKGCKWASGSVSVLSPSRRRTHTHTADSSPAGKSSNAPQVPGDGVWINAKLHCDLALQLCVRWHIRKASQRKQRRWQGNQRDTGRGIFL